MGLQLLSESCTSSTSVVPLPGMLFIATSCLRCMTVSVVPVSYFFPVRASVNSRITGLVFFPRASVGEFTNRNTLKSDRSHERRGAFVEEICRDRQAIGKLEICLSRNRFKEVITCGDGRHNTSCLVAGFSFCPGSNQTLLNSNRFCARLLLPNCESSLPLMLQQDRQGSQYRRIKQGFPFGHPGLRVL